jgi:hypothetical protein
MRRFPDRLLGKFDSEKTAELIDLHVPVEGRRGGVGIDWGSKIAALLTRPSSPPAIRIHWGRRDTENSPSVRAAARVAGRPP